MIELPWFLVTALVAACFKCAELPCSHCFTKSGRGSYFRRKQLRYIGRGGRGRRAACEQQRGKGRGGEGRGSATATGGGERGGCRSPSRRADPARGGRLEDRLPRAPGAPAPSTDAASCPGPPAASGCRLRAGQDPRRCRRVGPPAWAWAGRGRRGRCSSVGAPSPAGKATNELNPAAGLQSRRKATPRTLNPPPTAPPPGTQGRASHLPCFEGQPREQRGAQAARKRPQRHPRRRTNFRSWPPRGPEGPGRRR